jgi:hypothetical protein
MKKSAHSLATSTVLLVVVALVLPGVGPTPAYADARPDFEGVVSSCELFVEDYAVVSMGYRGVSASNMRTTLRTREGDDVVGVSLWVAFNEETFVKTSDPGGDSSGLKRERRDAQEAFPARSLGGGGWLADFAQAWNNYGENGATRVVKTFAYYVDLRTAGGLERLWLKGPGRDFTLDDVSPTIWNYSDPVATGGYASGRYLWRDGGSPLFSSRVTCAR